MTVTTGDHGAGRRRAGGRAAKRALRQAGPRHHAPGVVGGAYRPLGGHDIERIHRTVLDVLEHIGMADAFPDFREIALAKGCWMNARDRLCFPRAMIEDIIAGAARGFVLHGRDARHDLELSGARAHFATAGMAVTVLDHATGRYRPSTAVDLYDFARLADRLDNIHLFGRTVVATEIADPHASDMTVAYACMAGTRKPFGAGFSKPEHVADGIAMFDAALGGAGRFRERPFCTANNCAIVSPLRYAEDSGRVAMAAARAGIPLMMPVAAQAGATAPAALAGTLVQSVAETLAELALVNLTVPGHPAIFSNWPFVSDLRTGAFSGGGGEEAVLNAAAAQIANYYDLPCSVAAGMTDSKLPDNQAGYEKGITTILAGAAGANLVYESAGMLGSLLGCSFEAMVIDNDMLGAVQRAMRGIEVTDETLSYEVIGEVVEGPGHYLGHPQTLRLMETEYVYPEIADRSAPDEWSESGGCDIRERARERAREILATHYPRHIEPRIDDAIRRRLPILLPREAMVADSGRWGPGTGTASGP